jgi:hypothetical protein
MANTPRVYVLCDNNCKYESLTKEQIYTAIVQALENGTIEDVNTGFVQTIKTINNIPLKFFVGSQASYDALTDEQKENLFAIISDDTSKENLIKKLEELTDATNTNANHIDSIRRGSLAEVTITPSVDLPINCGNASSTVRTNKFTFNLPYGKTLDNLLYVVISRYNEDQKACDTLIGYTRKANGETVCSLSGHHYNNSSRWFATLSFVQSGETATGYIKEVYRTVAQKETASAIFLKANADIYGDDYIKLYFI